MPLTDKTLTIELSSHDLGQLLDGIRMRAEAWQKTADYLKSGYSSDDSFICEECSGPKEAQRIARHYDKIISEIEKQIQQQGSRK